MSSSRRAVQASDESTSSTSTKYSIRSFSTAATSPPRGPDPEDHGWYATIRTYPIKASDDIVKAWVDDGLCEAAMGEIRALENWVSVDVFRRGVSLQPSDCPPTIVISLKPGSMDEGCIDVVKRVKGHIERRNLDAAVEVVESSLYRQVNLDHITKAPGVGASIALKDNPIGSGTLGGFIQLLFPEMGSMTCAMTCHHVLRSLNFTPPEVHERGFRPQRLQTPERLVLSPSEDDMQDTMRTRLHFLDNRQKKLREMEKEKEDGCTSVARERGLKVQKQSVRIATENVRAIEGYDMELGYIFASSGFRVGESGCAMDWGLVEVDEKRVAGNTLRQVMNIPHAIEHVTNISYFYEDGQNAHKFGRSTNLTHSRFSFIKSHVRLPDSPNETTEHVFIPIPGVTAFSDLGDSGAWVFNVDGGLGGMIVGGHERSSWTYVTPITKVFEDIEKQLGCKVVLPDVYGELFIH